ncbi:MAG: flavohemoglobin expression-modulating QEGLA motif protein, partial [Gammaproteobacteria bacterium]|nr:flavohemoglobin expression-modulating QEGLA motif protein [Gammaproteobacteria bacterium]
MAAFSDPELERLEHAAALLLEAEERLPVLKTLAWDRSLADEFFRNAEKRMPCPVYPKIDPTLSLERIAAARAVIDGSSPVHQWLQRFAATLEETAALLASVGTPAFYSHSQVLYGEPQAPIVDGKRTVLELALRLDRLLSDYDVGCVRLEPPESLTAHDLKARLEEELPRHFGADAPKVEVTANVSAKAAAGRDYIKLREDAAFSDLDVTQLLQHEALIHIATTKNGLA